MSGANNGRLAVLIDADNAQASMANELFAEISRYGTASVKRAYGDWTTPNLKGWKEHLHQLAIQPIQQFSYTIGKNSTDSSLIIDAMDLLHTGHVDGFCLVSSDSDFTRLATRLRESGKIVYGFGEEKTPEPFVKACNKFIYVEVLRPKVEATAAPNAAAVATPGAKTGTSASTTDSAAVPGARKSDALPKPPFDLIYQAIEETSDESGWSHLGAVGQYIQKIRTDFDSRMYGSKKLSDLLKNYPKKFVIEERGAAGSGSKSVFVRRATTN